MIPLFLSVDLSLSVVLDTHWTPVSLKTHVCQLGNFLFYFFDLSFSLLLFFFFIFFFRTSVLHEPSTTILWLFVPFLFSMYFLFSEKFLLNWILHLAIEFLFICLLIYRRSFERKDFFNVYSFCFMDAISYLWGC